MKVLPTVAISTGIEAITGGTIGAVATFTLNASETVSGGDSLSETSTVIEVIPIGCVAAGVQVNDPVGLMDAPAGAPAARL